jgi:murein L,D-transpeptidase YcbB/YkuD
MDMVMAAGTWLLVVSNLTVLYAIRQAAGCCYKISRDYQGGSDMRSPKHAITAIVVGICLSATVQASVSEAIRNRVEHMMYTESLQIDGVDILGVQLLSALYTEREFQPLWPSHDNIRQLSALVELAYENGLDPADYPLDAVIQLLDAPQPLGDIEAADLDILATETLVRIGYQLRFGKVNPNGLFSDWNFRREFLSDEGRNETITRFAEAGSLVDEIDDWVSDAPLYVQMRAALARYRDIQSSGGWPQVPEGPTLHPGDSDPRIPTLRQRLQAEGDLTAGDASSLVFDEALKEAVMRFQNRHGLDADGVVGKRSYQALNVDVASRIDQLRASLERGRWVMEEAQAAGDRFVLVNVASAQLALMEGRQPAFITRVQVGKPYRQTPVFHGNIEYLVINPTWTVPPTILRKDVLPKLKADADAYLTSKHMDLLDRDGKQVDHSKIDWSEISARNFPYIVRQRPGSWNALGRVKFIFPNSHFVFLHDTPSRELFNRAERAFSSGCIRVENPFELAELVMNEQSWDQPAFQAVLDTEKQRTVHLKTQLPVFLMYWTGMADADGTVRFYEDIYGRDAVLLKAMAQEPSIDLGEANVGGG